MGKLIIGLSLDTRTKAAVKVQELLTEYGCCIRTRIGLHQDADTTCSENGVILLEMTSHCDDHCSELENKLSGIEGVTVKTMVL